jgi:hypothetical protein
MTAPICRLSALIWPLYGAIASITGRARYGGSDKPWSLAIHGLSERLPRGSKSGLTLLSFITAVSADGMCAMLVTTAPLAETIGFSGVKIPSTPKLSMSHRSLSSALSPEPAMAPACPTALVNLDFHRPTTQATTGLSNFTSRS